MYRTGTTILQSFWSNKRVFRGVLNATIATCIIWQTLKNAFWKTFRETAIKRFARPRLSQDAGVTWRKAWWTEARIVWSSCYWTASCVLDVERIKPNQINRIFRVVVKLERRWMYSDSNIEMHTSLAASAVQLRSASIVALLVSPMELSILGDRAFPVASPRARITITQRHSRCQLSNGCSRIKIVGYY